MKTKLLTLLLLSSLFIINGCDEVPDPDEPNPLTLADFLNNNKPALQTFHVTAGTAASITGAKGSTISFGANSFFTLAGVAITSGDVEIHLREVTNKKDMVLCQVPTVSDDELIVSQGVYYLKALQNGFELRIGSFTIDKEWSPYPITEDMIVFLGGINGGADEFNWMNTEPYNGIGPPFYSVYDSISSGDSIYQMYLYSNFISENYYWINCDYFYDTITPGVAVYFPTTENISTYFFQSYLVFNDLNAVLTSNGYSNNQLEFFNIPTGLSATLVTYYIVGGEAFVATANITTSDALSTPITFTQTTEQGLLDILGGL